ncbi:hypothetical protein [Blautia acetigignens]|uniref:Uncharacterized protein n=1 Tax=Blautia acetigignens TaxID=2981783 RepID=A0ABV1CPN2_9FIRM|nr:hypothetical protein [Blautia acetigignens]
MQIAGMIFQTGSNLHL